MALEVKQLYHFHRLNDNYLKVLLYLPLGLIVFILRLIILAVAVLLTSLPETTLVNTFLRRLFSAAFGLSVHIENVDKREDNVDAFISNSVSIFDEYVAAVATPCICPTTNVDMFYRFFNLRKFGSTNDMHRQLLSSYVQEPTKYALYFRPECAITNGKAVIKFDPFPFQICRKVQGMVITVKRPFLDINISSFDDSFILNALCFMFAPITVFNVKFLPMAEKKTMEAEEFACRMQADIARVLNVEASELTAHDLKEWSKRYKIEQQRLQQQRFAASNRSTSTLDPQLNNMAHQVKEVLPMVPLNTIIRDLLRTRNVDLTITNILEGIVPYTPEPVPSTSSSSTSKSVPSVSTTCAPTMAPNVEGSLKDPFNTAAKSFGKSASERSLSFQERKAQLIANARRRYIEKHGLAC